MANRSRRSKTYLDEVDKYVIDLMIKGMTPTSIIQELMENWEFKTVENAKLAIRRCNGKMAESNEEEIINKIAMYKEMYLTLYKNAIEAQEVKTAREVLDSLVKLESLTVQKVESKIDSTYIVKF